MASPVNSTKYRFNKFKGDSGSWLTRGLFADVSRQNPGPDVTEESIAKAHYCLWDAGDTGKPMLRDLFMEMRDITGIRFANKYLGGYDHLQKLLAVPWFKKEYDSWIQELRLIYRAEAIARIEEIQNEGSAQSLAAAKYLAELDSENKGASKRGRPSSEEVTGELKRAVRQEQTAKEDYNRMMGLTVITGGKQKG